jgi:hypothetical protein
MVTIAIAVLVFMVILGICLGGFLAWKLGIIKAGEIVLLTTIGLLLLAALIKIIF